MEWLSAHEAVRLDPWRGEEESVFAEIKGPLPRHGQPLWRSKTPPLVVQEVDGLPLSHDLVRRVMLAAARQAGVAAARLSFKTTPETWAGRLPGAAGGSWWAGLVAAVARQRVRPKRVRSDPRVKKATRSRRPAKKPGAKPPPQPTQPFAKVLRITATDGH